MGSSTTKKKKTKTKMVDDEDHTEDHNREDSTADNQSAESDDDQEEEEDVDETFVVLGTKCGIDSRLRKAIARLGHIRPTLVQSKCLPLSIKEGRDLLVKAKTGSGKTLAYSIPLLHKVLNSKRKAASTANSSSTTRAVVLVPSKELVHQVYKTLTDLTYYCDDVIKVATLTASSSSSSGGSGGGSRNSKASNAKMQQELAELRDGADVLVATPSGLFSQLQQGTIDLRTSLEMLVVDEADLVLSYGYINDVEGIIKLIPRVCQGMLMSATLSPELNSLKKIVLHSPVVLKLEMDDPKSGGSGQLSQFYLSLPRRDKNLVIYTFLKLGILKGKGIFFVNSTDGCYRLKLFLEQFHIRSTVLNGELPFRSRVNIIEQFNVGNLDYVIASDESTMVDGDQDQNDEDDDDDHDDEEHTNTKKRRRKKDNDAEYGVSRGLDFRGVSFVLNVDFPPSKSSYTHRIGRTARGGANGVALSLVEDDSSTQFEVLREVQDDQPRVPRSEPVAAQSVISQINQSTAMDDDGQQSAESYQPSPLDFDLGEIEGFRYRVDDVSRAVTKSSIKEARAAELRAEVLNSDRLQSYFEENPTDLQLLRHDRVASNASKIQDHLKHVPKYLLPRGMQVASLNKKRKRRKVRSSNGGMSSSSMKDPLQSFNDGDIDLSGLGGDEGDEYDDEMPEFGGDAGGSSSSNNNRKHKPNNTQTSYAYALEGNTKSTSGRRAWKEKHKKGKFSKKASESERKSNDPLGM
mmetsp:Transcript_49941/g.120988  ORF Transcript_49941/g.120988 Transcript_49941/m.120988 type:complete len:746 (+) Transcript_49941:159-2396(+)